MNNTMRIDEARRPDLFHWNGPIPEDQLRDWLAARNYRVPDDLLTFWSRTGGGTAFETETLFGPFSGAEYGDDLEGANRRIRAGGLRPTVLLFHEGGVGISGIDQDDGRYLVFAPGLDFTVTASFLTLDSWYAGVLRAEYAERYSLL